MKPLKLSMSAFSSYANEQIIDFTRLGNNGLYLITGETGSGKTTIFDAISFALYGKASGDSRSDYSILRSDFAKETTKTYVELDFISGDKKYRIKRVIKNTGQEVTLALPDGTTMTGDRNIKPKIIEIIGLEREQFAQIIMIAQNDFLRFLQSKTEDRLEILRRIFNTEVLKKFLDKLKELVANHKNEREIIIQKFNYYNVDINRRNEKFIEWEAQIKADKTMLTQADQQLDLYDNKKQTLAAEIVKAIDINKDFDELDKFRRDYKEHQMKTNEMKEINSSIIRGKTSLYKIKPFADDFQKAEYNLNTAINALEAAIKQDADANNELAEAIKLIDALPFLDDEKAAFDKLSKDLEVLEDKLVNLETLKKDRNEIAGKQDVMSKMQEELNSTNNLLITLPPVADCQAEFDRISEELKINEDKHNKLSALKKDFDIISGKQKGLADKQKEFINVKTQFDDIDEQYRVMDNAFITNQAGIIAGHLIDGEPCPVCGSNDHPAPAKLIDIDISELKLKKAKETREKARLKLEEKTSECSFLKAETETMTKRFIDDLSVFISDVTIESAVTLLPKELNGVQLIVKDIYKKKKNIEEKLVDVKLKSEDASKKQNELIPKIAAGKSEIETLKNVFVSNFTKIFQITDWENSGKLLDDLLSETQNKVNKLRISKDEAKKNLDILTENWNTANNRKAEAGDAVTKTKTLVIERTEKKIESADINEKAMSAYINVLKENNFTEMDYKTSLITQNEITELENQVLNYEKKTEQLIRDIERLDKETTGKERPDIEKLKAEQKTVIYNSDELKKNRDEIYKKLSNKENMLKELRRAAVDFDKIEKDYSSVRELSDTANGKLNFETYAQMAYFEHVIRAANIRLRLMSKNRYTMLRKTDSDDARKRMGLELEVLDAYTGKVRSANSLSGGESFMASLSLALGLSDIVQQSTGGIRLDAMFIDEGFGSLDTEVLELAVRTLSEMAGTNRIIGIISHITELRDLIDKRIQVEKTMSGSRISLSV